MAGVALGAGPARLGILIGNTRALWPRFVTALQADRDLLLSRVKRRSNRPLLKTADVLAVVGEGARQLVLQALSTNKASPEELDEIRKLLATKSGGSR